jgi:hypothetical protein
LDTCEASWIRTAKASQKVIVHLHQIIVDIEDEVAPRPALTEEALSCVASSTPGEIKTRAAGILLCFAWQARLRAQKRRVYCNQHRCDSTSKKDFACRVQVRHNANFELFQRLADVLTDHSKYRSDSVEEFQ